MGVSRYYLHKLPPHLKNVYKTVLEGFRGRKEEIAAGPFPPEDFQRLIDALHYDNPELFYVGFGKTRLYSSARSSVFRVTYTLEASEQERLEKRLNTLVASLRKKLTGMTMRAGALYLHDYLLKKSSYGECESYPNAGHNILGPLLCGKCVCEGYAKAYKYLADTIGLPCIVAIGEGIHPDGSSGGHAWNLVRLGDACFHVDVTFDSLIAGQYCSRAYFLLSTKEILTDHSISSRFALPDCPAGGGVLQTVAGTAELLGFLEKEYRNGASHSEVRMTKGFTMKDLTEKIRRKLSPRDMDWYSHIGTYWYRDYSRTLFICWK